MRRYGLFAFFAFILAFSLLHFDGDEGSGGGGESESDDLGEIDLGEDESGGASGSATESDDTVTVPKSEFEKTQAAVTTLMQEKNYNETIGRIKDGIPDFDVTKVVERLKEIAKTDSTLAESYNNENGFKLLWHEEFQGKSVKNDPINSGNNSGGSDTDFDKLHEQSRGGNNKALDELLDASKA